MIPPKNTLPAAVTVQVMVEVVENVQGAVTKVAAAVEGTMVHVKRADKPEGDAHVNESEGDRETAAAGDSS